MFNFGLGFISPLIQGGSIKPLLRFGGGFFRISIRFRYSLNMIVICVILSVYSENFITKMLALLRYRYLHKSRNNPLCPQRKSMGLMMMRDFDRIQISLLIVQESYV